MAPSDVRYDMLFTSLFFCLYVFLLLPFLHRRRQGVLTAPPLNTSSRSGWSDLPLPCRTRETDSDAGDPERRTQATPLQRHAAPTSTTYVSLFFNPWRGKVALPTSTFGAPGVLHDPDRGSTPTVVRLA